MIKIDKVNHRVAVLMGGISNEREVSLKSGRGFSRALSSLGYNVFEIDTAGDFVAELKDLKPHAAVVVLHGRFGEGGQIQGVLEIMGIPYTGSGVLASSLSLDKGMSKNMFSLMGIKTPEYEIIDINDHIYTNLKFPIVVKPCHEGSTIGFTIVTKPEELAPAAALAGKYSNPVLLEKYIKGREMTVGVIGDPPFVLPPVEIIPQHEVFDYDCKYTKGMTKYVCPAEISHDLRKTLQKTAVEIHTKFNCFGMSRTDFIVDAENNSYTLEINTIPGMTETSLLPMMAEKAGYTYESLCEMILLSALPADKRR
jgi:D-alanine-D-alanine ligase